MNKTASLKKIKPPLDIASGIVGMKITDVWRGHGSAIFLELGKLTKEKTTLKNGKIFTSNFGEYSVMIEWDWRIEKNKTIYVGSASTDAAIDRRFPKIIGKTIDHLEFEGRMPELYLGISEGYWLRSCAMTTGKPRWVILQRMRSGDAVRSFYWENGGYVMQSGLTSR